MVFAGRKEEADLICSVHHLSQLITGYRSITQLQTAGCVEVRCEPGLLDSLFPRKALYILDMF